MAAACSSAHSFAELSRDARRVPVPAGLAATGEHRSVEDGPGFTTATFREVTLSFSATAPCPVLQRRWVAALHRAGRRFRLDVEAHLYGGTGQVQIALTDRPEHLGVTLGGTDAAGRLTSCAHPFVWSFDDPH